MYCSACGRELKDNLNFCNNCGARIARGETRITHNTAGNSSVAVSIVGFGGLIGFIAVLKILLGSSLSPTAVVVILLAYLITVFLLCAVIVGQKSWKNTSAGVGNLNEWDEDAPPKSFRSAETAQLNEHREPASVVENTTRTLHHELVERK